MEFCLVSWNSVSVLLRLENKIFSTFLLYYWFNHISLVRIRKCNAFRTVCFFWIQMEYLWWIQYYRLWFRDYFFSFWFHHNILIRIWKCNAFRTLSVPGDPVFVLSEYKDEIFFWLYCFMVIPFQLY